MKTVAELEQTLRTASCKADFLKACRDFPTPDVVIDRAALQAYAQSLSVPKFISPWTEYMGNNSSRALDFVDLAASTVLQGGFLYQDQDGSVKKWEIDGSGAKALITLVNDVRAAGALPAIQTTEPAVIAAKLTPVFQDIPFGTERLKIWEELARPEARQKLIAIHDSALQPDGTYKFGFDALRELAAASPAGFGEDPFLKKAALLPILFAGVAHHKVAPECVKMDLFIPADYRAPQTLHGMGILRFSDALASRLESGGLLTEDDSAVAQIRARTIEAADEILRARPDLQIHHIDGELWFAGRLFDSAPEKLDDKKKAIRHRLESFGKNSGFLQTGFLGRVSKPMNVATMRF